MPFFLSFFLSQTTTGAMIFVTMKCRRAEMRNYELVNPVIELVASLLLAGEGRSRWSGRHVKKGEGSSLLNVYGGIRIQFHTNPSNSDPFFLLIQLLIPDVRKVRHYFSKLRLPISFIRSN